jgi:hypothetical protein
MNNIFQTVITAAMITTLALRPVYAETINQKSQPTDKLAATFANPPLETRPGCYWYWFEQPVTQEGITRDLEAMRKVGIGRAYLGIIGWQSNKSALTEPWWDNVRHAIREAGRVGVEIGFFNSPGWSQSGGPWVKPEQSMRYVTSSEITLKGPQKFSGSLPQPQGMIQQVAVIAFPAPKYESQSVLEKERTPTSITFEAEQPVKVRSVTLQPVKIKMDFKADLAVSDDGITYRPVTSFPVNRSNIAIKVGPMPYAPVVSSFPPVAGRYFRLSFSNPCELGKVRLTSALRNGSVYEKQMAKMYQGPLPPFDNYSWASSPSPDETELVIAQKRILNLSSLLKPDGTLEWEVPAGEWIVQRVGMSPTGAMNDPAPPQMKGPEVDKMNQKPLKDHFEAYIGKLLASMPPEERKAFKYVIADSYEQGPQNWTDGFAEIFLERFVYDPIPWLAALTGRVVESPEQSDRFLWDMRRLVADRIATEYVGGLRDLSHEKGLSLWLENYGHWGFPAEFLQYGGQTDEVAGEFWVGRSLGATELRCAASAAHIYGKKRVWAESYTAGGPLFRNTPRELKADGDWSFAEGVNHPILSVYIHQPWEKKGPGTCYGWGTEFNRHNSWWNLAMKPWIDYQRKCTVMLQAGLPVADVAYFIGEDTPKMTGIQQPALPKGYDYDYINAEVIQTRLSVKDGRLVLPDGTSYRVLVLPPTETMRPEVLRKIKVLVDAGATVVGPAPKRSPSMENFPQCDQELESLVKALWGSGKIRAITDLQSVLPSGPDVVAPSGIVWKHRTDGNREIYFIANQENKVRDEAIAFRVKGKTPEFWWPESGKIEPASAFKLRGDQVEVPLHLEPLTSMFVIFEKPANQDRTATPTPTPSAAQELTGAWEVQFEAKNVRFEQLIPWTEHTDPDIKYFSGEVLYRKEFVVSAINPNTTLDLGAVNAIAKVNLNGQDLGTLWKPPYRVNISSALKVGKNALEITLVDTWNNRIIGDLQPGATSTVFISRKLGKPTDPLQPSGLLGPVTISEKTNSY